MTRAYMTRTYMRNFLLKTEHSLFPHIRINYNHSTSTLIEILGGGYFGPTGGRVMEAAALNNIEDTLKL